MEDLAKIKERIAKLLAMADDSSSPEEAAIAAGRARKLMDKHQLEAWECAKKIEEPMAERKATRAYGAVPDYIGVFASIIGEFNDCQSVYGSDIVTRHMDYKFRKSTVKGAKLLGKAIFFRGYETDVQMCCDMFDALMEAASKQCKSYLAPFGFTRYPVKEGTAFKTMFVHAVGQRLREITIKRDQITSTGTSLIVAKMNAVNAHFGDTTVARKKAYEMNLDDPAVIAAAHAGLKAGESQKLMEEIGDESSKAD